MLEEKIKNALENQVDLLIECAQECKNCPSGLAIVTNSLIEIANVSRTLRSRQGLFIDRDNKQQKEPEHNASVTAIELFDFA